MAMYSGRRDMALAAPSKLYLSMGMISVIRLAPLVPTRRSCSPMVTSTVRRVSRRARAARRQGFLSPSSPISFQTLV
jgi:hypothetical protein